MRFTNAPRLSCGSIFSHGIRYCWIFLGFISIQSDLSCIFSGVPDKIEFCFAEHPIISSSTTQEEMEATHIMITSFNFFYFKAEMVIQLRVEGLYRFTMGTEVEPNSAVEKDKYFNRLDE